MLRVAHHADDGTGLPHKVFKRVFQFPLGNYTQPAKFVAMAEQGDGPRSALVADADLPFLVASSAPVDRLGTLDLLARPWAVALGALDATDDPVLMASQTGTCVVAFDTTCSIAPIIGFHSPVNHITAWGRRLSTNVAPGASVPGPMVRTGNLINISGDRYIMLRCPQIETSAYIGTGRNSQRGIGMFKLSNPGVIRRETADYVNVIKRRFHPIAKLDRLNFRFERAATGQPYNFRGVGTLMIVAIDRYVNTKPLPFERSTLNPDYNIDYREYQLDKMRRDVAADLREQDMLPLDDDRVTLAIARHNAFRGGVTPTARAP
jgi:hypothetical protein